uniref:Uncharacterized protein n=1 Tax=Oryza glumipatula TaxID=40148 RepID=A0A0D9YN42_9ORYZ
MVVGGWEQVQMHRSLSYLGPKNTYSTHHRTAFLNGTYVRPGAGGLLYSPRHRVGTDSHPTRLQAVELATAKPASTCRWGRGEESEAQPPPKPVAAGPL